MALDPTIMKILIAEDNADDRKILRINLEHHGCKVFDAIDGVDALRIVKKQKPDLIISDALMPNMDGFQFLRAIKTDDALKSIPFIFYSAVYTGYQEAQLAISLGAEAFIIKPKDPQEFWEELFGILEESKLKKEKTITARLIDEEEEFLRKYSHVVASKLEEKVKELTDEITERKNAEEAIQDSAQKWQTTFDAISDSVCIINMEGKILQCNKPTEVLLDKPMREIIGNTCWELVHGTSEPIQGCPIVRMKESHKRENLALQVGNRWLNVTADPIFDEAGALAGAVHIIADITENKRTEQALTLMGRIGNIFLTFSDDDMYEEVLKVFLEVMKSSYGVFGYLDENGDLVVPSMSRNIWDKCQVSEKEIIFPRDKWGDSTWPTALKEKRVVFSNEPSTNIPEGHISIIRHISMPIVYNNESIGLFQVANKETDYSDDEIQFFKEIADHVAPILNARWQRNREEKQRRTAEDFIKNILESVEEGFIVIDTEYRIISANRAYCELVKAPDCDIIGKHCYEVSHHSDKPCFLADEECAVRNTFKTGEPGTAIHTHYDKDHNPIFVETKSFPMRDNSGKIFAVIETQNNITEKRKLEDQLRHAQKMEALGTLVGGIAHDFNNMLNIIIGYAGLMEMRMKDNDAIGPQVKEILAAGDRAAQLTRGLLTFSRKQVMEMKTVNINEIVEGFKKMLSRIIGEDIDLHIVTTDEDLTTRADIGQIEQVLMNLSANARDAMTKGGTLNIETSFIKINRDFIRTHGYGDPGKYALITVSDTGIGMDENTRERIFEPYFTTKEKGRGTGLGLAIIYGIVTQHNGYIHCYSEPGKGTTFRIYIPLIKAETEDIEKEEAEVPKGGSETILIAEDDVSIRKFTTTLLEEFGYKVIAAVDGEDAVNKFRDSKDKIQLLLFDLIMPKKNGKDAYEEIKAMGNDISVIFMSGYARDIIQKFGIENGIEFISKPVLPNELLRKIREELDR